MGYALASVAMAEGAPLQMQFLSPPDSFVLWQLPEQTPSQMMSYVLVTEHKQVIVIDGGREGDAPYLRGFLKALGNEVEAWVMTHPHADHYGALKVIASDPEGLVIHQLYGTFPDPDWYAEYGDDQAGVPLFLEAIKQAGLVMEPLSPGQVAVLDGVRFEVLATINPELTVNPINNQSLVMRVEDDYKSILFTGDAGAEESEKLLAGPYADRLACDYVQMAHHGQQGATEAFYRKVNARWALWPTPKWLWDNDTGGGKGSGPWKTLETRAWMEKLGIERNITTWEGLAVIR